MAQYVFTNAAGEGIPISESYQTAAVMTYTTNVVTNRVVFSTPIPNQTGNNTAEFEAAGPNQCLRIKHAGSDYSFFIGGNAPQTIGVACFKILGGLGGTQPGYRIVAVIGQDETTVTSLIHGMGWNYQNHVVDFISEDDAEGGGLVVLEREWDEAPSSDPADPNNEDPRGGGYADTDPFDETDIMSLSGLPDPETWELDYGNLVCPYCLTANSMQKIGAGLFLANFWTDLRNKFTGLSDPLSFILDAVELPISTPDDAGIARFRVGGELVKDSAGNDIGCGVYTHRYYKWSMGSITLKEVWGTALDYSDTAISIYLPYVGVKDVDTDIVLNCTTTLYLYMDVWNGDILYLLHASNANSASKYFKSESVVYRWSGNCGKKLPLGRVDQTTPLMTAAGNLAGLVAGFAIGGPAGAGMAAGATFLSQGLKTASHGFTPTVQTSGGIAGSVGRMDYHNAYYIIKRSVPEYPNNWRQEFGAPRYQEFLLSSIHGYTEIAEIHADDVDGASDAEKKLIEQQLMQGVILP